MKRRTISRENMTEEELSKIGISPRSLHVMDEICCFDFKTSAAEVIEKFKDVLTEEQLKKIINEKR
jgi:hypothetical protein